MMDPRPLVPGWRTCMSPGGRIGREDDVVVTSRGAELAGEVVVLLDGAGEAG